MTSKDNKEPSKNKNAHKNFSDKVKEFKKALDEEKQPVEIDQLQEEELGVGQDVEKLTIELEEAKKLGAEYLDKLRRNMAEFDNYRKRTVKEKAGMYDEGAKDAFEKLIPVLDHFELALNAATNKEDNFYKGVDMIFKQCKSVLFDAGVEEIPALGCQFNPAEHNAVAHITDAAFGENEIIEEMRKGYRYKDKILRPSMVRVAN